MRSPRKKTGKKSGTALPFGDCQKFGFGQETGSPGSRRVAANDNSGKTRERTVSCRGHSTLSSVEGGHRRGEQAPGRK